MWSTLRLRALFTVAILVSWTLPARADFRIRADLPGQAGATLALSRELIEERSTAPLPSLVVGMGTTELTLAEAPGLFNVSWGDRRASFVAADDDTISITLDAAGKQLLVQGGRAHALYQEYEATRAESLARHVLGVREAARAARDAGNQAELDRLTEAEVAGYITHRRELNDFALAKLGGSAALYAASLRWDGDYRLDDLARLVADYQSAHPDSDIGRRMTDRIKRFQAVAIGAVAPELAGPTPDGGTLALSSLRGRYVLVDFWASWCAPCRIENRNYAALYAKYHAAGFEIFAVSVDQNANAWKAGIKQDKAVWKHIGDATGWKTPLAAAYNVAALPASFLLDPDGRIIAKDARGDALASLLAERLGSAK